LGYPQFSLGSFIVMRTKHEIRIEILKHLWVIIFLLHSNLFSQVICPNSNEINVGINPDPTITLTGGTTLCIGGSSTLSASKAGGIGVCGLIWQLSDDGGNNWATISGVSADNYTTPSLQISTSYRVIFSCSAVGCNTDTSNVQTINIIPDPLLNISGPTAICYNTNTNLVGNISGGLGSNTFRWEKSFDDINYNIIPNETTNSINTGNLLLNTYFRLVVTQSISGCEVVKDHFVSINPLPVITVSNGGPYCIGNNIQLNSSGGDDYQWSGPLNFSSSEQNPLIFNSTLNNSGVYSLTVTDNLGCISIGTTNVSVGANPNITLTVNPNPVCTGDSVILLASPSSSNLYFNWRGPKNWAFNGSTAKRFNLSPDMSGRYSVSVTDGGGCFFIDSIQVNVLPKPNVLIQSNSPVCLGQTLSFNATGANSYLWSGPINFSGSGNAITRPNALGTFSGQYSVTATDANGCKNQANISASVASCNEICDNGIDDDGDGLVDCFDDNCELEATFNSNGPVNFCQGQNVIFSVSGGSVYNWSTGATTQSITVSSSGNYSVTVVNSKGCQKIFTSQVTVYPIPSVSVSNFPAICEEANISITASGGVTYNWVGPNGFTSSSNPLTINNASLNFAGLYNVSTVSEFGCIGTRDINILINPKPLNVVALGGTLTCNEPSIFIQGNASASGINYSWIGPDGFTSPNRNAQVNQIGIYTLTVTDNSTGCFDSDTAQVFRNDTSSTVFLQAGNITCRNPSVKISNLVFIQNGIFTWTGPNGFSSTLKEPIVSVPGTYNLVFRNPLNGCITNKSIIISQDLTPPIVSAHSEPVNCENPYANLSVSCDIPSGLFYWSGPDNFSSRHQNPKVSKPGVFTVRVENPENGCSSSVSTSVVLN
jgi:hypothetical protein